MKKAFSALIILGMIFILYDVVFAVDPVPDIIANNSNGTINITPSDNLSVTVELNPGSYSGNSADWWLAVETTEGWYYYDFDRREGEWVYAPSPDNVLVTHQGPLFGLSKYEVVNISGLPAGTYVVYFGVDMNMNGLLDFDKLYYDSVSIMSGPPAVPYEWIISAIDSAGDVGEHTSIAIDSINKVHISYRDDNNNDLKYITNTAGTWKSSIIDNSVIVGDNPTSIAADSNNKAHIAYHENTNVDLKYATNASGVWVTSTVDSAGWVGHYPSIAVDSENKAHISYENYSFSAYDLKYATNASGSWIASTIDTEGGSHSSIAVDSNNKIHISYEVNASQNERLKYTTNASGPWTAYNIDTAVEIDDTSVAIDSNNKAHISYHACLNEDAGHNCTNGVLKYATNAAGSWTTYTIDIIGTGGIVGEFSSIALDTNDKVHIAYYDRTNGDLKHATNSSGSWVASIVDSEGDVGWYCSIAVGPDDKVHISYHDSATDDLKYATNR